MSAGPKKRLFPRLLNDMTSVEICKELQKSNSEFDITNYIGTTSSINIIYENTVYVLYCYRDAGAKKWGITKAKGISYGVVNNDIKTFEELLDIIKIE